MHENSLRILPVIAILLFASGCATIPFQKPDYVPMEREDPAAIVENFTEKLPKKYRLINSIVFEKGYTHRFAAIGITKIDLNTEELAVAAISPLGLKLFEVTADRDGVTKSFAVDQISEMGDFAEAIAKDIKRIYFNLAPHPDAKMTKKKYKVIFESPYKDGTIQHIFAGSEGYLVQKKFYEKGRLSWSVSYYEYVIVDGKLYQGGIIMDNRKHGYRLIIRRKGIDKYE